MSTDRIVLESDLAMARVPQFANFSFGLSLPTVIDSDLFDSVAALADRLGIDRRALCASKPWWVALTLTAHMLEIEGFKHNYGVDKIVHRLAIEARKEVFALEPSDRAFYCFDGAPQEEQVSYLALVARRPLEVKEEFLRFFDYWNTGSVARLQDLLISRLRLCPRLFRCLVARRNVEWAPRIHTLLNNAQSQATLIVVGAMHLVGARGLPVLLEQQGHSVIRLDQTT